MESPAPRDLIFRKALSSDPAMSARSIDITFIY
jgi:hypothetical protein